MIQLFNADCLEKMKDISSNSVDLVICDLPFGCLTGGGIATMSEEKRKEKYKNNQGVTIHGCDWDVKIDLDAFWKEVKRIRKNEHSPTIHFCTTKYGFDLYNSNPKEFRYDLVWDKGRGISFLSANKMPMRSHEMMYVFSKAGASYNRVDVSGNFPKSGGFTIKEDTSTQYGGAKRTKEVVDNTGKKCVKSVIQNPTSSRKKGHPTEKPIDLYTFLIERYCPVGGTVLDPTFGSCNSGQAAKVLGRNYIGIEKDKEFYEKAVTKLNLNPTA